MFQLTAKIPKENVVNIAFSGGIDSLAVALYYRNKGFHTRLLHFHHGCEYSDEIEQGCRTLAEKLQLPIIVGYNDTPVPSNESLENAWRKARYRFLYEHVDNGGYIVSAHHSQN